MYVYIYIYIHIYIYIYIYILVISRRYPSTVDNFISLIVQLHLQKFCLVLLPWSFCCIFVQLHLQNHGSWHLDLAPRFLHLASLTLDLEHWTLNVGSWILHIESGFSFPCREDHRETLAVLEALEPVLGTLVRFSSPWARTNWQSSWRLNGGSEHLWMPSGTGPTVWAPVKVKLALDRQFWASLNDKLALDRRFWAPLKVKLALDRPSWSPLNDRQALHRRK